MSSFVILPVHHSFSNTVPDKLNHFANSISGLISDKEYKSVSDARYGTREFAASTRIDQVDLAHMAMNMGSKEGEKLLKSLMPQAKPVDEIISMTTVLYPVDPALE